MQPGVGQACWKALCCAALAPALLLDVLAPLLSHW